MSVVEIPMDLAELCRLVMAWRRANEDVLGALQAERFQKVCEQALGEAAWRYLFEIDELTRTGH